MSGPGLAPGAENGTCRKCGYPIEPVPGHPGEWVALSTDTADGLSYCPPNPDYRGTFGRHILRRGEK